MVDGRSRLDQTNVLRRVNLLDFGACRRTRRQQFEIRRLELCGEIEEHADALRALRMRVAGQMLQIFLVDDDGGPSHGSRLTSERRPCKTAAANLAKPREIT
jgi:hypothetical protein